MKCICLHSPLKIPRNKCFLCNDVSNRTGFQTRKFSCCFLTLFHVETLSFDTYNPKSSFWGGGGGMIGRLCNCVCEREYYTMSLHKPATALKVPSGQTGSSLECYHWIGLEKDTNCYRFFIFYF